MEIYIRKSETADTRTCDFTKVSKEQLLKSSIQHIGDVDRGLAWIAYQLLERGGKHDWTKIAGIDQFHADFTNGFKTTTWWDDHRRVERHHLAQEDGIPDDVDLIDVIEFLLDGVMAGLARSGKYRKEELPQGLLQRAFDNTVDKICKVVQVLD